MRRILKPLENAMLTVYVYNIHSLEVVAEISGTDTHVLIAKASGWTDLDDYAATFTPAFGINGGLIKSSTADILTI